MNGDLKRMKNENSSTMIRKITLVIVTVFCIQLCFSQNIRKVRLDDITALMDTSTTPLIINFWATWCQPCVHEIPWFEKNIEALQGKKVKLLLVNLDFLQYYPKAIAAFAKEHGYHSEIVWLEDMNREDFIKKISNRYSGTIPISILVNNARHYRRYFEQQLPEERFKQELQKLIEN